MLFTLSNNEIVDSVNGAAKKRFHTPIYGTFALAWAAFHWDFLYTAIFTNQEIIYKKTGLLKNEYIHKTFFNYSSFWFYALWILPFLVTWLIIWKLPKLLLLPAFRRELEYRTDQRMISIAEERKVENEEKKLEETSIKRLEVTTEKAKKEKAITKIDPTALWPEEYEKLKTANQQYLLTPIMQAVYEHQGNTIVEGQYSGDIEFEVPMASLVAADTNGLIEFTASRSKISLTEKGKYFVKRFSSDKT